MRFLLSFLKKKTPESWSEAGTFVMWPGRHFPLFLKPCWLMGYLKLTYGTSTPLLPRRPVKSRISCPDPPVLQCLTELRSNLHPHPPSLFLRHTGCSRPPSPVPRTRLWTFGDRSYGGGSHSFVFVTSLTVKRLGVIENVLLMIIIIVSKQKNSKATQKFISYCLIITIIIKRTI